MTATVELMKPEQLDDDARWAAVTARSHEHDGMFVTAVRSTGIYCRPSCPARHPKRENVTFFRAPQDAATAGYRACLRCHPDETSPSAADLDLVRRACRYTECAADETDVTPTLESLALSMHVTPSRLRRAFSRTAGVSPQQYLESVRLQRLKSSLSRGSSVTSAIYEAGYRSSSRVYEHASRRLGMTPATYAKRGRGVRISYAIASSSIGRVLVASTDKGLCRVAIGGPDEQLERLLLSEYAEAEIGRDDERLGAVVAEILRRIEGYAPAAELPLDIQATAFQWRVWQELQRIPFGDTRSYAEIARSIGSPPAARAVGRACATNPVPIVIPCHRVNGSDGKMHGFRWGLARKRELQEREAQSAHDAATNGANGHSQLESEAGEVPAGPELRRRRAVASR
jgi:AraC family transcriptional regulator of adaptative response/methylated-DNA-[protein]-cysteine methyltransferase